MYTTVYKVAETGASTLCNIRSYVKYTITTKIHTKNSSFVLQILSE